MKLEAMNNEGFPVSAADHILWPLVIVGERAFQRTVAW
jgi:hypothetical protein